LAAVEPYNSGAHRLVPRLVRRATDAFKPLVDALQQSRKGRNLAPKLVQFLGLAVVLRVERRKAAQNQVNIRAVHRRILSASKCAAAFADSA
jgi:hypothetical protein